MRKLGNFFSKLLDFWRDEIERRVYKPLSLFVCFFLCQNLSTHSLSLSMQFFFYVVVTLSTTKTDLHPRPINQLHTPPPNRSRPTLLSNDLRCMTNLVRRTLLGKKRDPSSGFEIDGLRFIQPWKYQMQYVSWLVWSTMKISNTVCSMCLLNLYFYVEMAEWALTRVKGKLFDLNKKKVNLWLVLFCGSDSGATILCTIRPCGELWLMEEWTIITSSTNHNSSHRRIMYKIVHKVMALKFSFLWINPTDPAN